MKITIDKTGAVDVTHELLDALGKVLTVDGVAQTRAWSFVSLRHAVRQAAEFPAVVRDQILQAAAAAGVL